MSSCMTQRWRDRRDSYRPAGEVIVTRSHEVAAIAGDAAPKQFVTRHHYSGSYPAARRRFGLYHSGELVGVAVFSHPSNDRTLAIFPGVARESIELGRFVLLDEVAGNGETWFLGRCFELLRREGFVGVVSFSDPMPRVSANGEIVHGGHVGTIYQAHNGVYLGRARAEAMLLLPDGRTLHRRTISKIRTRSRGWRYAAALLERHGAGALGECDDAVAWIGHWLPRLTRRAAHPGNHRYAWMLARRHRRHLPLSLPYPKNFEAVG